jgi:hypothetical protein
LILSKDLNECQVMDTMAMDNDELGLGTILSTIIQILFIFKFFVYICNKITIWEVLNKEENFENILQFFQEYIHMPHDMIYIG